MSTPFQDEALEILREAAGDARQHGYPPDAAFPARLAQVVRDARDDGGWRAALAIAGAWELFLDDGDPEILARTIDDHLPPGFAVRRSVMTGHRTAA
jgi:hypothetical protein